MRAILLKISVSILSLFPFELETKIGPKPLGCMPRGCLCRAPFADMELIKANLNGFLDQPTWNPPQRNDVPLPLNLNGYIPDFSVT